MIYFENIDSLKGSNNSLDDVLKVCSMDFSINLEDIFVKSRKRELVNYRQVFYYVAKKNTRASYERIIFFINDRFKFKQDHSTLVHSRKQVEDLKSVDKGFKRLVDNINYKINTSQTIGLHLVVSDVKLLESCSIN